MGTRRNIVTNATDRADYIQGVLALKQEATGLTTADMDQVLHAPGVAPQPLSTWDLFVLWHSAAMSQLTPANLAQNPTGRNAAHLGPVFLPWHRWMLLLLEFQFQRVLGKPGFGLPYWDWAADGQLPGDQQPNQPLWNVDAMGGDGGPGDEVQTGPFRAGTAFRVHLEADRFGRLWAADRPLQRRFRRVASVTTLPTKAGVVVALGESDYDESPWDGRPESFRNLLEGWEPSTTAPNLHNRVHVWVGGDMGPSTSPNDPVFYLNHCNVDRVWAAWQSRNPAKPYLPSAAEGATLFRHRREDPMFSLLTAQEPRVSALLDASAFYVYDSLAVDT